MNRDNIPALWLLLLWTALLVAVWPLVRKPQDVEAAKLARATALNAQAIASGRAGNWAAAVETVQRALLAKIDYEPAWQTMRWLNDAKIKAHPTPEFYQAQALGVFQSQRYGVCIANARNAIRLYPEYTKAWNLLSVCYLNLGLYDAAIAAADEAVRIEPDFQLAKNNRALAQQRKATGAPPTAPPPPTQANNAPPAAPQPPANSVDALLNSSVQNYRAGHMQACIDDARAALKLNPNLAVAYNNVAACSNDLGRPDDAIRAASEALRLQPDFQLARNNLAVALNLKSGKK